MFVRYYGRKGWKGTNWELIVSRSEHELLSKKDFDLIMNHTRWVLDNLDWLPSYRVVSDKAYDTLLRKKYEYYDNLIKKHLKEEDDEELVNE